MDDLLIIAGIVAALIAVSVVIRERMRAPWLKELAVLAVAEANRNRLGALRTQLMTHAREERIRVESPVFQNLYRLLTVLMRCPDQYQQVAQQVLVAVDVGPESMRPPWKITRHEAAMLIAAANAMDLLCRDYNPSYKQLARVYDWATRKHAGRPPFLVRLMLDLASKTPTYRSTVQPVRAASRKLAQMGGQQDWRGAIDAHA